MENREIYQQIKGWAPSDVNTFLLERSLEILGLKIENAIHNHLDQSISFTSCRINEKNKSLLCVWNLDGFQSLQLEIDEEKIHYGMKLINKSHKFVHQFDESLNGIIRRYFSNFEISKNAGEGMVISSKYSVGIRQLNSRDFISYTVFVFSHALRLMNEILAINAEEHLKIAV